SFQLFADMLERIKSGGIQMLARIRIRSEEEVAAMEAEQQRQAMAKRMQFQHAEASAMDGSGDDEAAVDANDAVPSTPTMREGPKIGRNDPCPCGSGKKYKHCHGRLS